MCIMISIDLQVLSSRSEISIDWPMCIMMDQCQRRRPPGSVLFQIIIESNSTLQHLMPAAMWLLLKSERSLKRLLTIIFSSSMVGGAGRVGDSVNQSRWTENISIKVKNLLSQWKICLSKCVLIILFKNISNKHSQGPSLTFNNINIHTLKCSHGPSRLYFQHLHLFNDCLTREQRKSGRVSVDFLMLLYLLKLSIGWID